CFLHPPATFFFFQAEDGIRDFHVTGVQTCALPILKSMPSGPPQSIVHSIFVCLSCVVEREPAKSPVPTASMIAQAIYEPGDVRQDRKSVVEGKSVAHVGSRHVQKENIN